MLDNLPLADHVWPRYEQNSTFRALGAPFYLGL
jgi:hypothetical protein